MEGKKLWGLIGNSKIEEYSVAPVMWKELFKKKNMPVKYFVLGGDKSSEVSVKLQEYLKKPNFVGVNVALPWKYLAYEFCEYVEESANRMDAINTLVKKRSRVEGHNTDGIGIVRAILRKTNLKNKVVLLIGCGSSAQTIPLYLIDNNVKKIYVNDIIEGRAKRISRKYSSMCENADIKITPVKCEGLSEIIGGIDVMINATPCGMKGYEHKYPFEKMLLNNLKKDCLITEAVYTPYETPILKYARGRGNPICQGVNMLVEQAAESFFLAFGTELTEEDKGAMRRTAIKELLKDE